MVKKKTKKKNFIVHMWIQQMTLNLLLEIMTEDKWQIWKRLCLELFVVFVLFLKWTLKNVDCVVFDRRSCCFSLFGFSVRLSLLIIVFVVVVNEEKSISCTETTNSTIFSSTIRLSKNICLSYSIFIWLILWTYFFPPLCKIGWHHYPRLSTLKP